jgi:hypothetical protein
MSNKMMSLLLILFFFCVAFCGLGELGIITAHAFFPERLADHYQGLCHIFSQIFTEFDARLLADL